MKLIITRFERRTIRETAKQNSGAGGAASRSLENRCELREETDRRLAVVCEFSPLPKGVFNRILKTTIEQLKKLFVRLWLRLHSLITH